MCGATTSVGRPDSLVGADFNGDGLGDIVMTPRIPGPCEGTLFLYLGKAGGPDVTPSATFVSPYEVGATAVSTESLAAADVNGDGYPELLAGSTLYTVEPNDGFISTGTEALLFAGTSSGPLASSPTAVADPGTNELGGSLFAQSVASAGDVNGDGFEDLLMGNMTSQCIGSQCGQVFLYLGASGGISATPTQALGPLPGIVYLGTVVAGLGDTNGDGYSDIAGETTTDENADGGATFPSAVLVWNGAQGAALAPTPASTLVSNNGQAVTLAGRQ
jgi:hypothetical protein